VIIIRVHILTPIFGEMIASQVEEKWRLAGNRNSFRAACVYEKL